MLPEGLVNMAFILHNLFVDKDKVWIFRDRSKKKYRSPNIQTIFIKLDIKVS